MEFTPSRKAYICNLLVSCIPVMDIVEYIYTLSEKYLYIETREYYRQLLYTNIDTSHIKYDLIKLIKNNIFIKYDIHNSLQIISTPGFLLMSNGIYIEESILQKKLEYMNKVDQNIIDMDYNMYKLTRYGIIMN